LSPVANLLRILLLNTPNPRRRAPEKLWFVAACSAATAAPAPPFQCRTIRPRFAEFADDFPLGVYLVTGSDVAENKFGVPSAGEFFGRNVRNRLSFKILGEVAQLFIRLIGLPANLLVVCPEFFAVRNRYLFRDKRSPTRTPRLANPPAMPIRRTQWVASGGLRRCGVLACTRPMPMYDITITL